MDTRGQISAEYILMVGFIVVVVLIVAGYAGEQNEQNIVASAVRDGASNATTEMSLLNRSMQPVRVNGVSTNGSSNITITINLSNPSIIASQKQVILTGSAKSLTKQGFAVTNNGANLTLTTARHNYLITIG
ncbi:MAG TPA: class III signal peptide-containing protein [Methanobacteriaceae archaeon]|nr:class III signal peptide-containing protein [Methanobacteriaceae archaeon]